MTLANPDFSAVHTALQRYVDNDLLAGVSSAVLIGRNVVDLHCAGWADREARVPVREDHIFRIMSNTKLITSCAVLLLFEEGRLALDDPIEAYIPQLGGRQVLRPNATELSDTEPARSSITVRQLLSHSSGLSYGAIDPGTMMFKAYNDRKVLNPLTSLAEMIDALEPLPLSFHPGCGWEYSIGTDVLGRLIEIVSGESFDQFIKTRIFQPLGMSDTGFVVPRKDLSRLATHYLGADLLNPLKPGLERADDLPFPGAFARPVARLSGGGGLVSTLPDMIALIRSLLPGGPTLLKADTIRMMMRNQLPEHQYIRFARLGEVKGKGFGLGGAVTLEASSIDPKDSKDEFQWGGVYGTHWWISPNHNLAGLLMTQRHMGFWHPYSFEFKKLVYKACLGG